MNESSTPPPRMFPSTRWSLVGEAAREDIAGCRPALGKLLAAYLPALRAHLVRRRGCRPEQAEDLVQGFILSKVLEGPLLGSAQPSEGKFRTLLLTALDRYLISQHRFESAAKRSSGAAAEWDEALGEPSVEPPDACVFDLEWARQVLAQALQRMRDEACAGPQAHLWGIFEARILRPALDGVEPVPYEQLIDIYHLRSPSQATNTLATAKRAFQRHLRAVVREYAADEPEVEAEMIDLQRILLGRA
jgi:DNA-directed RNA polymerase specialized sigma24 family protein